jgi:AcrR family transcriptional regulator
MPLPRFERLPEERRETILRAAAVEFGAAGFEGASFNRIIERAGLSKGAMYYYFSDKEDLYRTVVATSTARIVEAVGRPAPVTTAEGFWDECRAMYERVLRFLFDEHEAATLCFRLGRQSRAGNAHPAERESFEMVHELVDGLARFGQGLGAVRDDVPVELLVEMAFGAMDGMDVWLATRWESVEESDLELFAAWWVDALKRLAMPTETKR